MHGTVQFTFGMVAIGVQDLQLYDMVRYHPVLREATIEFMKPAMTDLTLNLTTTPKAT